jgi:hypothetical protein
MISWSLSGLSASRQTSSSFSAKVGKNTANQLKKFTFIKRISLGKIAGG